MDIRRRLDRMIGLLPGLRDTREAEAIAPWVTLRREAARHDLAPYAARVGELRLAPVGVREVEQRERRLDVPPAPACDEVEERVAARDEAPILDRGAVVEEADAERGREAVAEVEREAAVRRNAGISVGSISDPYLLRRNAGRWRPRPSSKQLHQPIPQVADVVLDPREGLLEERLHVAALTLADQP
ncbi:MAG: hypothetical protein E6J70_14585, partial [Deltaproteobacteria bacterium]